MSGCRVRRERRSDALTARDGTPGARPARLERIQLGIAALRDVTRALRGAGAAKRSGNEDGARGAMFDLAALADRLAGFAEDQTEDDWADFWLTSDDVQTLRTHTEAMAASAHSFAAVTIPSLRALADTLDEVAQRIH